MEKWEYTIIDYYPGENVLNKLGEEGWELVAVSEGKCYFKRRKS